MNDRTFLMMSPNYFLHSENCTCTGIKNEWGQGAECKIKRGYEDEFMNSRWCYAETTKCRDATNAEYRKKFYVDKGRYGPSQSACIFGN